MDIAGGEEFDVIVVGAGNAATCARRLSAREDGARVLMLEVAPEHWRGGNSAFTGGALRIVYHGFDDLARLIPDMSDHELANVDVGTYTEEQYYDDMGRLTEYRSDPDLTEILITRSFDDRAVDARAGRALPAGARPPGVPGRRQVQVLGRARLPYLGRRQGIDEGAARPRRARADRDPLRHAGGRAAAGRRRHRRGAGAPSGHGWSTSAPRRSCSPAAASRPMPRCGRAISGPAGTSPRCAARASTPGRASKMALDIGAAPAGHWSGAHACAWDLNAPPFGDLDVGDRFQKHNYPFGIVVNAKGERFLDEGLDFHSYTYAKYGGEILKQPGMFAWQVFDQKAVHLLRDEYRIPRITKEKADTLRGSGREARRGRCRAAFWRRYGRSTRRRGPRCRSTPTSATGSHPRPGDRQDQLGASASIRRPTRPMP